MSYLSSFSNVDLVQSEEITSLKRQVNNLMTLLTKPLLHSMEGQLLGLILFGVEELAHDTEYIYNTLMPPIHTLFLANDDWVASGHLNPTSYTFKKKGRYLVIFTLSLDWFQNVDSLVLQPVVFNCTYAPGEDFYFFPRTGRELGIRSKENRTYDSIESSFFFEVEEDSNAEIKFDLFLQATTKSLGTHLISMELQVVEMF